MTHRRIVAWALVTALLSAAPLPGQAPASQKVNLHEVMAMEIPTEKFVVPLTLKDFIGLVYDSVAPKGLDVKFVINEASFREACPDFVAVLDFQVHAQPLPRTLPLAALLETALGQLPCRGGLVLHGDTVEIVAREHSTLPALLWQRVSAKFDETPLDKALRELSDKTGVSVVVDPRVKDKKTAPISAEFRRDVNLESALRMLANMADLKIVLMDRGVFVTTSENAATLEQELKKRRDERQESGETDPERRPGGGAVSAPPPGLQMAAAPRRD